MKKVFIVLGCVVLLGLWYLLFIGKLEMPKKAEMSKGEIEEQTLQGLEKALGVKATLRNSQYVDWISPEGKSIPLSSKQMILGTNGINGIGKYGNFTTDELTRVNPEFLNPLAEKIRKYYLVQGFSVNKENTNSTPNDLWFRNLGFEKEGIYCVNNLAKQSDPFGYLSCGVVDEKQLAYQREFSAIYEEAKKEATYPVLLIFRVEKVDGNYALGSASSIGGWMWIGKKIDGKWRVVWEGQDYPTCSDMYGNGVPLSIYKQCYNPVTQQVER